LPLASCIHFCTVYRQIVLIDFSPFAVGLISLAPNRREKTMLPSDILPFSAAQERIFASPLPGSGVESCASAPAAKINGKKLETFISAATTPDRSLGLEFSQGLPLAQCAQVPPKLRRVVFREMIHACVGGSPVRLTPVPAV